MPDEVYLSVVIPAYNEELNIQKGVLDKAYNYLNSKLFNTELIIVDDESRDSTPKLLDYFALAKNNVKILHTSHGGKAFSLMKGLKAARGEIVLFIDMDQATPITEFDKFTEFFDQGYAIVIGSRGTVRQNAPFTRRLLSQGQIVLRNIILGFKDITDTQCGFKAYRRETINKIVEKLYLFNPSKETHITGPAVYAGYDVEVLFVAKKLGIKVKEVPVVWNYQLSKRVSMIKDALRGIKELITLKLLDLQGKYKISSR